MKESAGTYDGVEDGVTAAETGMKGPCETKDPTVAAAEEAAAGVSVAEEAAPEVRVLAACDEVVELDAADDDAVTCTVSVAVTVVVFAWPFGVRSSPPDWSKNGESESPVSTASSPAPGELRTVELSDPVTTVVAALARSWVKTSCAFLRTIRSASSPVSSARHRAERERALIRQADGGDRTASPARTELSMNRQSAEKATRCRVSIASET